MIYTPVKMDFNKLAIYPLQNAESWQRKTRWLDLHFVYFPLLFRHHFITSVTLVTAKKQHRCWKARATRTREEFFSCVLGFWGSYHSQTFTRPFFYWSHFRHLSDFSFTSTFPQSVIIPLHSKIDVYVNSILHFDWFWKKFVTFLRFFPS